MKTLSLLLAITLTSLFMSCSNSEATENENKESNETSDQYTMSDEFIHVVYFWLHNPESQSDRAEFESAIKSFIDNSEFAKGSFLGKPANTPREVVNNSWHYNLIVTFDDKEQQDMYQDEPAHVKFVEDAKHLWDTVVVYDALNQWN